MGRGWRPVVAIVLLIGLVVWVQSSVGWRTVLSAWARVPVTDVAAIVTLTAVGYLARARRLAVHFGSPLRERPGACLRVMVLHNAVNNLLPMRSGEISFPVLLRREFSIGTARAVTSLVWLRILDLCALVFAVAVTLGVAVGGPWLGASAIVIAVGTPVLLWRVLRRSRVPEASTRRARLLGWVHEGLPSQGSVVLRAQGWTLVHWSAKIVAYAWLVARLGGIDPVPAVLAAVAGEATSVLPVHGLAGAGTYEAGVLAVLRPLGVALEPAVQAAVNLHLFLLVVSVAAAAFALVTPRRATPTPS